MKLVYRYRFVIIFLICVLLIALKSYSVYTENRYQDYQNKLKTCLDREENRRKNMDPKSLTVVIIIPDPIMVCNYSYRWGYWSLFLLQDLRPRPGLL
ncbi:hypothetical protein COT44_04405 [Candidatus Shapirobacteria bacterium CG08_land_8_20_14_0_20_39_18]|uniref:Uncharacterized protein n=1 Tax=Candidatus Shapirobacteria bacterium CG08_land_8_20_14_0_20_39_18 TaxID=1974883 RepID=A0A2M6XBR3_9BACT|nr:MAG: hypothetical protein COT44_04405 [Candidatus Shapirobacteria bacterium CG08_land_8_20_14_0_20_39_18]PIY65300.1 MAG: hypothetical protein COY91_02695 [Candidatus Shapirobacteria bacterium CG_4_10_14_0_8_um_filter_39_15]PJE68375.1 MAG: hypothetical protein COU94_02220 [Candidatus Shapirobacteria bacterium CG10_big_fil_rev_8_21_14_0_10_38_8]